MNLEAYKTDPLDLTEINARLAEFKAVLAQVKAFNASCWLRDTYRWHARPRCRSLTELAAGVGRLPPVKDCWIPFDGSTPDDVIAACAADPLLDGSEADQARPL